MSVISRYRLRKNIPGLKAGAIFEHRGYDRNYPDRGNIGNGVMILPWGDDGGTQQGWAGDTFILPGQLAKEKDWFTLIEITIERDGNYKQIRQRDNYNKLLNSGMFWEFYPELSGNWEIDKIKIRGY